MTSVDEPLPDTTVPSNSTFTETSRSRPCPPSPRAASSPGAGLQARDASIAGGPRRPAVATPILEGLPSFTSPPSRRDQAVPEIECRCRASTSPGSASLVATMGGGPRRRPPLPVRQLLNFLKARSSSVAAGRSPDLEARGQRLPPGMLAEHELFDGRDSSGRMIGRSASPSALRPVDSRPRGRRRLPHTLLGCTWTRDV